MRKTPLALLASSALILPTAVLAAPAEATHVGYTVTNCYKTQHGVDVRIRIRDEGDTGRVRLSHPLGRGGFLEPRVARIVSGVKHTGPGVGGGASVDAYGNRPSYRTNTGLPGKTEVIATFFLRNGKKINMSCTMR